MRFVHPNIGRNLVFEAVIKRLRVDADDPSDFEDLAVVQSSDVYDMGEQEKELHGMTTVARAGWCQCSVPMGVSVVSNDVLAVGGAQFRIVQCERIPRLSPHLLILRLEIR